MKKRSALAVVAVVAGISTGVAGAVNRDDGSKAFAINPGQAITFGGMTCTAYKGTTPTNANIVCVRNDLKGYGVIVSQDIVVIGKKVGPKVRIVYQHRNR